MSHLPKNFALICLGDPQGRDEYVAELQNLCAAYQLEDRVTFPGHSTDIPAAMACADIVISASTDPEAFGRIAAEAQAMQRPIVATAHGGALETVLDRETGFLVKPDDAKALAAGIQKAIDWKGYNPEAARQHIQDKFSKESLQRATLSVYRDLLL